MFARLLEKLSTFYLIRCAILLWMLILAIPLLAFSAAKNMLEGLFALETADALGVTVLSFLVCWQVLVTERLVRRYGPARVRVHPPVSRDNPPLTAELGWREFLLCGIPGFVTVLAILWFEKANRPPQAGSEHFVKFAAAVAGGILIAAVISTVIVWLQHAANPPGTRMLGFLPSWGIFGKALDRQPPRLLEWFSGFLDRGLAWIIVKMDAGGPGFIENGELANGHLAAFLLLIVVLFIYGIFFIAYTFFPLNWVLAPGSAPALMYLLLLLSLLGWLASFLCFFLDRYHWPTITLLMFWAFFLPLVNPLNGHYYALTSLDPSRKGEKLTPAKLFYFPPQRVMIVSAEGGGIHSAAWTTQVLTSLAEEIGEGFAPSVRLMSGVSGGSVGLMYFNAIYNARASNWKASLEPIRRASRGSSLSDVGFGMVYYDLSRPFLPYVRYSFKDRGWAIERAWRRELEKLGVKSDVRLSELRQGLREGKRPMLLFNATIGDTGKPLPR